MLLHFNKYHGTGNDFVMLDGRSQDTSGLSQAHIAQLCDRRFGIGADGLIILLDSPDHDFTMRYYNADGREGSMCGNGGRCIVAYAHALGLCGLECAFESIDGLHHAWILLNGDVRLKLADVQGIQELDDGYFLDTGSPHFVHFEQELTGLELAKEGKRIRHQERFAPGGTNVNFVAHERGTDSLSVRTFERGVEAETFSCGTGVTAAAICAHFHDKSAIFSYQVLTLGGQLQVSFSVPQPGEYREVHLTGPAKAVYKGEVVVEL